MISVEQFIEYMDAERYEEIIKLANNELKRDPKNIQALLFLVDSYRITNQLEKVDKIIEYLESLENMTQEGHYILSEYYIQEHLDDKAREHIDAAMRIDPDNIVVSTKYVMLNCHKKLDECVGIIEQVYRKEVNQRIDLVNTTYGWVLMMQSRKEDLQKLIDTFTELDNNGDIHYIDPGTRDNTKSIFKLFQQYIQETE